MPNGTRSEIFTIDEDTPVRAPAPSIFVLGSRGFPGIAGGVERHCEELCTRLAALGCRVRVLARASHFPPDERPACIRGVAFRYLYAPRSRVFEALVHTLLGVCHAARHRPDILHVHAVGPSLLIPLARLFGLTVVMTHHGPDYARAQWGWFARGVLRLGEAAGLRFANRVIGINPPVDAGAASGERWITIPNGIAPVERTRHTDAIAAFELEPGDYILAVGRLVVDKGFDDLIAAWSRLEQPRPRLVIAGAATYETAYSRRLAALGARHGVSFTGAVQGQTLAQLYSHAKLFVSASHYEGMSVALLEAIGYGCAVLASDIDANRAFGLDAADYFPVRNVATLHERLAARIAAPCARDYAVTIGARHDWDAIAEATLDVYRQCL